MEIKKGIKIVKASTGETDKLVGIHHISCSTFKHEFCKTMKKAQNEKCICKSCYASGVEKWNGKNDSKGYEYIGELLKSRVLTDREIVENCLISNMMARINKVGELHNMNHFENIVKIAKFNRHTKVSLFTKRADLVLGYKGKLPNNLILVYSNPVVDAVVTNKEILNKFHKVFNVTTNPAVVNCGMKKCIGCQICYKKTGKQMIYELLK